ncbi:polymorphic toxin-type HINT domain-containing protein, partial [Paraglaciecola sp.]
HSNKVTIGSILAKSGNTQVLSKTYDYDGHGNATSIIDNLNSQYSVTNFSYDGIDRLLNATSSAWGGEVSFSYDVLGNIKTKTLPDRQLTYAYGSGNLLSSIETSPLADANSGFVLIDVGGVLAPIPFGVQASTDYFNHDTRGNITYNSRHTLTFNEAEQLTVAAADSDSQSYLYDALGKRVQVIDSQGNITYEIYDSQNRMLLREDANGDITRKIYLGNKLVASNKDGTLEYIHFDTLGSTIGVSDSSKNLDIEHYFPFGERVNKLSANNDQWYTGHKFDDYVDLSYMQGRYYDPMVGRFYSSDPVGYTAKNPVMSFNRYLYVNNNPFKYTDPDGEFINFAVKFVADVALGAAVNYLETGDVNLGGAIKDAAIGVVDPTKTIKKAKRLKNALSSSSSPCKLSCFVAGTEVLAKDGHMPIEDIQVGELVWAKNVETGESKWKPVTHVWVVEGKEIYEVGVTSSNGIYQTVEATERHPFYVTGKGWVDTIDLKLGDKFIDDQGRALVVDSIRKLNRKDIAYNFTVADFHTYYVTKKNVLVHNCNKGAVVTSKEAKQIAESSGYKQVGGKSKGQAVYGNKKADPKFITRDVDGHNGGAFKGADKAKDLGSKSTRKGTYDKNIKKIGD